MEERHGEARHHDGRRYRDTAEQQYQPNMQPRAGRSTPAFDPYSGKTAGQHRTEQQHGRKIGEHKADAEPRSEAERGSARHHYEGGQTDREGQRGQHQRCHLAEQDVGELAKQ